MDYYQCKNDYYYWRNMARDYKQKAQAPGMPLALKMCYQDRRVFALRAALVSRALMLEMEKSNG